MQICKTCRSQLPKNLLACPVCNGLVYRDELEAAARQAGAYASAGNYAAARDEWRLALQFLPPETNQATIIAKKIEELTALAGTSQNKTTIEVPQGNNSGKKFGIFVAAGVLLWKFKFIFAFILTKAKFLVLGLTKASTFFSIILSMGFYWSLYGWQLAVGLLLCIYVHEMGHVFALNHYGIKASAPMFIPGFGAYVRLHENPANAIENARVGLGGPVWGLFAALACYGLFLLTHNEIFRVLARLAGWVNLFNLIPFWQLDGNRGLAALARLDRLLLAGVLLLMFLITHEGLLALILIVLAFRVFAKDAPTTGDSKTFYIFAALIIALALLAAVKPDLVLPRDSI